jgi:chemotaxis protein methyltransferase CheR
MRAFPDQVCDSRRGSHERSHRAGRRLRVTDRDCSDFLQWALPRLGLGWAGFRKPRRQVCRRIERRRRGLGLSDVEAYRARLEVDPGEWRVLDQLCVVTISRFWRDRAVFDALASTVLPALSHLVRVAGRSRLKAWSAGCASGEEPYSLRLAWDLGGGARGSGLALEILATDVCETLLERARRGCWPSSSLKDLPSDFRERAFETPGEDFCLRGEHRHGVDFRRHDLRDGTPDGGYDLVLCRNVAFTYLDAAGQRAAAERLARSLLPGGALVLGTHESLPSDGAVFVPWGDAIPRAILRRAQ